MSLRIDRNSLPNLYSNNLGKEQSAPASTGGAQGQRLDKIELSSEGRKMRDTAAAQAIVKSDLTKEMASEKLQAIRDQIQSGTYSVPARDIAAAMLYGTAAGDE